MSLPALHELDAAFRIAVETIFVLSLLIQLIRRGAIPLIRDLWDLLDEWRERRARGDGSR